MPQFRQVPIDQIKIDPRYQRAIDENHVKKLVKEFDPAALGTLELSQRENGEIVCFDGQHRLKLLEAVGQPTAPSLVHTGLSPEQEAELFRKQDRRKPVSPVDKYRSRLFAGDPVAKGMQEIAEQHRFKIGVGPGSIQAVVALERSYRRGNLSQTLKFIGSVWRGDKGALDAPLIDGLSRFFDLYQEEVEVRHAEFKFSALSPMTILRRAGEFTSSSKAGGVVIVLRDNYSDRQHVLPSVERAVANRVAKEREGSRRYVRVSAQEVRDAVMALAKPPSREFRIEELREALGGISRAALTNQRTGHLHKMLERGTIKWRMPRDGEKPGRIYFVAPVERTTVNRRRRRTPENEPPAGTEVINARGVTQRNLQDKANMSRPGEGHRERQRTARRIKQEEAKRERAEKQREKSLAGKS